MNPSTTAFDACCHPTAGKGTEGFPVLDIDCSIQLNTPFALDFTVLQGDVSIKVRLVGPENAPVVVALGGISANRHVCDPVTHSQALGQNGWWRDFAGPGKALDTQTYRLLSFDFLPGDEDFANEDITSEPLKVTPGDQARIARVVCDYFGIAQLHAFVGSSYGGMVALCFGALYPERVKQLIVACAAHRPHPIGTAWRSIQRKIVRFGLETQQPNRALSLARELGMTTYRTPQEFGERFAATGPNCASPVEEYLETRGQAFIGKMTPQRYLSLSHSIDLHHVNPVQIDVPVTYIAFRQDQLVPIEEIRGLFAQLPQPRECFEFDSIYGHDAFLKEIELMSGVIHRALGN